MQLIGYDTPAQRLAQYGAPVPPRKFDLALDALHDYHAAGQAWQRAGKPQSGQLFDRLIEAESEYNKRAEDIWFGAWSPAQRAAWDEANR